MATEEGDRVKEIRRSDCERLGADRHSGETEALQLSNRECLAAGRTWFSSPFRP